MTLVIWGKYDPSFVVAEPAAYQRDLPKADVHIRMPVTSHYTKKSHEVAGLIGDFLRQHAWRTDDGQ